MGPHMYGMGPVMYLVMTRFHLHLPQVIAPPSRFNKEATTMDKVDFSTTKPCNKQKGDS